jgi:hypothetical protein
MRSADPRVDRVLRGLDAKCAAVGCRLEHDHSVAVGKGKRIEDEPVDDAEERRVRSDAEGTHDDRRRGESRRAPQLANAEPKILRDRLRRLEHGVPAPARKADRARIVMQLRRVAEFGERFARGVVGGESASSERFGS